MDRVIDQFMWGYQPSFRSSLEYQAQQALRSIGLAAAPQALLIGFANGEGMGHQICVEPEKGLFQQTDFSGALRRAEELYATDEDRGTFVTGEGQQEKFEARSLDKSRRSAILEALTKADPSGERRYWVGASGTVDAYRVFPVLSVQTNRWPIGSDLPDYEEGRLRLHPSFAEELIHKLLSLAAMSLVTGPEPHGLVGIGDRVAEELVRAAARSFMDGIPLRIGALPADVFDKLNELAATPYEGKPATGSMVFAREENASFLSLRFATAVSTGRTRQVRKLLELSDSRRPLIFDGGHVFGLGADTAEHLGAFRVDFFPRSVWTLSYKNEPILRSALGRAALPTRYLFRSRLVSMLGGGSLPGSA
tara:strand:- start:4621 stop:5712 length:1092 start_codon:yes stop_codon:yes gene_type:complete